jgi:glycosyltransferase involved in cell wall biosynthesis
MELTENKNKNMYKTSDISIVIPSYNNLEYLKSAYKSVREISKDIELILYDDNSNDGTKEWLLELEKEENDIIKIFDKKVGHPVLYDVGFNLTKRKIIGILHADMIIHKDFFTNILKYINPNTIVCGTCAEPPIHPPGNEKYILDAGFYPNEFNQSIFNDFYKTLNNGETNNGIFAPWFLLKEDYIKIIGKHDTSFFYCEDVDIFNRMVIAGFEVIQSRDALVYHFTQRGHKFEKGIIGKVQHDYQDRVNKDTRNYIRKWGSMYKFDINHRPIPSPKYNIAYVVKNCNSQLLEALEPWCDRIYIENEDMINIYIDREQKNTSFDLSKRVFIESNNDPIGENDIVVELDSTQLTQQNFQLLQQLSSIIKESGEIGEFELDIFAIKINHIEEYTNNLIKI